MIITNEALRRMCIEHELFDDGSNEAYTKLFEANSGGATLEQLALIIWVCTSSDDHKALYEEIVEHLKEYTRIVETV